MIRCPNKDCEYHGYDGCYKSIELIESEVGGLRCLQYTPRITHKDLDAPFNPRCHREGNRFKSNRHKVVR